MEHKEDYQSGHKQHVKYRRARDRSMDTELSFEHHEQSWRNRNKGLPVVRPSTSAPGRC